MGHRTASTRVVAAVPVPVGDAPVGDDAPVGAATPVGTCAGYCAPGCGVGRHGVGGEADVGGGVAGGGRVGRRGRRSRRCPRRKGETRVPQPVDVRWSSEVEHTSASPKVCP